MPAGMMPGAFLDRTVFGTPEGRKAKYDESKRSFLGMPLPEFGVSEYLGLPQVGGAIDDTRGYITGYDTRQTPFQVAKERGLAGVLGGGIDASTFGMTDFDKRGDSKKQKDTKEFLRKFVYGTDGMK